MIKNDKCMIKVDVIRIVLGGVGDYKNVEIRSLKLLISVKKAYLTGCLHYH